MEKVKVILLVAIIVLLFTMLTGCAKLNEEDYVIKNLEELYPNAKCVGIEDGLTERNLEKKTYYFDNGDFKFEFCNYLGINSAGLKTNNSYCNYYEKLYEFKKGEINNVLDTSLVPVIYATTKNEMNNSIEVENFEKENTFRCVFNTPNSIWHNNDICFEFYINKYSQIEECTILLNSLYNIVKEYIPDNTNDFSEQISITFHTPEKYSVYRDGLYQETDYIYSNREEFINSNINIDDIKPSAEHCYLTLVKDDKIIDTSVSTDNVSP